MAADPTDREARIDRLCGEYLTAAGTGRAPDRATWLAQHPDLADELGEFLDCLNEVGRRVAPLRAVAGGDTIDHHPRDADAVPPGAVSAPHGYEILEKIAEGGMGVVYRARAVELNRVVALKMIRAGDLAGAAVQRFRQEAAAAAGFDHPHIVPVYEVGVTDAGDPFFSMKLVEGRTLGDWIADGWGPGGPLRTAAGIRDGIRLLAAVTRGVHYAHQRGFLHRDLKPANVLLDGAGVPYVTDFGLAKRLADSPDDRSLTQLGGMVGTLGYMAPEQARGEKSLTTAADVYALGAILFQVLTGRPLRPGNTLAEVSSHLGKEPPRPRSLNRRADHDLEAICLKCLEDKPAARFGSAEALADELDRWGNGLPVDTRPPGPVRRVWMWARRRPDVAALLTLTVLVFFAGVGLVGWKWRAELAARREVQAQASRSAAIVAQSLLEEGTDGDPENLGSAMLWWARSFGLAPAGSARERSAARVNLAALAGRLHTLREVWERPDPASHLVLAPDGRRGAVANGDAVRVLDAQSGGASGPALAHPGVRCLAFSPDGDWLATAGGGFVRVWDLRASPSVSTRTLPFAGEIAAVAIGPGGSRLAVAGPDFVRLFEGGGPLAELPGVGRVDALAFDRSGNRLATGGADKFARVWDAVTGKAVGKPLSHDDGVRAVAFSPDGSKLVTGSDDHVARIWSLGTDGPPLKLEHQDYVRSVAVSPDGRLVASGGADSAAQVWEADTGRRVGQLLRHGGGVGAVGFAADGAELVTASTDGATRVWALSKAARTERAGSLGAAVFALAPTPEGSGVYAGTARGVTHFDQAGPAPGREVVTSPPGGEVWAVACTARPGWVAAGGRTAGETGWMRVWRSNGADARSFTFDQPVRSLAFAPNGTRLLVATADASSGEAWEWNPDAAPRVLMKHRSVWAVAFSPDGTRYATSADEGGVQVWDSAQPPRMVRELKHPWRVVALKFHADGERLVTASTDRHVRVWSTAAGDMLSESSAHRGAVWAAAVSPDGRLVVTAGRDRCVRAWDATAGTPVGAPLRHRDVVWAGAFGGGQDIWSGSEDGTLRRWRVPDTTLAVPDEHLETWTETVTGQRLDGDRVRVLGASGWRERRDHMSAQGVAWSPN